MLRTQATVEEQLILKAIKEECSWENLPKRLQSTLNSKEDWHRRFVFIFPNHVCSGANWLCPILILEATVINYINLTKLVYVTSRVMTLRFTLLSHIEGKDERF